MKIETEYLIRQTFVKVCDIRYWLMFKDSVINLQIDEFDIDYFHGNNDMVQEISNQLGEDLNGEQNENENI